MRRLCYIAFLLCQVCLNACHQRFSYPHELKMADSLANVAPESALVLLQSMESQMADAPQATQMYHRLLCIKANDKAYIPHTTDTLILPVLHYYEEGGDPSLLSMAYYYAGRVYRDLNDAPQALAYFQKGLDAAAQINGQWVSSVLYAQMGEIYFYQSLYPEALHMYAEAYKLDAIAADTIGLILDLRDMAFTHRTMQQPDSALTILHQAEQLARLYGDDEMRGLMATQLAGLYNQLGDYEEATRQIEVALPLVGEADKYSTYDVYANILLNTGQLDAAKVYYEQMIHADEAPVRLDAYNGLATIAAMRRQADDYLHYFELYKACSDTIRSANATESVSRMNAMYNYQLREKDNIRLQAQVQQHQQLLQRIGFVASIILLLLIIYVQHNRRKRLQLAHNLERLQLLQQEQYRQSEAYVETNRNEIVQLQEKLSQANQENKELILRLERQKEQLENANLVAEIKQGERRKAETAIQSSDLMRHLLHRIENDEHLNAKDLKGIESLLDEVCPDFRGHLRQLGEMNPLEYQVSLLIKLGISPAGISTLVLRDKSTVSAIRRRLLKKTTGRDDVPAEWDNIIHSL